MVVEDAVAVGVRHGAVKAFHHRRAVGVGEQGVGIGTPYVATEGGTVHANAGTDRVWASLGGLTKDGLVRIRGVHVVRVVPIAGRKRD